MTKFVSTLTGIVLCFSAVAFAGPGSTGGGYMDFNGKKILNAAIADLNKVVPAIQMPMLQSYPDRRMILLEALNHVDVRSKETRKRNGQSLVMDFDLGHKRVIALKPFFEGFQTFAVTPDTIKSAEQLLLHEVAHLWGDDDIQADSFANDFLTVAHPAPKSAVPAAVAPILKSVNQTFTATAWASSGQCETNACDLEAKRKATTLAVNECENAGFTSCEFFDAERTLNRGFHEYSGRCYMAECAYEVKVIGKKKVEVPQLTGNCRIFESGEKDAVGQYCLKGEFGTASNGTSIDPYGCKRSREEAIRACR